MMFEIFIFLGTLETILEVTYWKFWFYGTACISKRWRLQNLLFFYLPSALSLSLLSDRLRFHSQVEVARILTATIAGDFKFLRHLVGGSGAYFVFWIKPFRVPVLCFFSLLNLISYSAASNRTYPIGKVWHLREIVLTDATSLGNGLLYSVK